MIDYEQLGAFFLGRRTDTESTDEDIVMYDSRDLTTHAVIVGMTGSGKTGLGIDLMEEALIDRIPVIAIDPKGDIGSLALRFPSLEGRDFEPWIDPQQAETAGLSLADYAAAQAELWRNGLAKWGQGPDRIRRLMESADVTVYTPGSSAGVPLSLLKAFAPPPDAVRDDEEAFAERVSSTVNGLLALLGIDADPVTSREHILIASILSHNWQNGRDADLPSLIASIQSPPFTQLGVMPVDTVFPAKDRMALAMRLNNLLASPGFQQWMKGDPIDTASLLYTATGKPRASVISIAHLSDAERVFFVTLLLADVIAWMRAQPGTGSLRAILYIDEIFGYMPPVANPSTKPLLLTLLKQARAFGLGVVIATQNPVDLDYRGLSNAGTWFIGRLQTERDKLRLLDGLEGASGGAGFDRATTDRIIAGLGKRRFLLHSVHNPEPLVFETRWALSYLAGPMTREQIKRLGEGASDRSGHATNSAAEATTHEAGGSSASAASYAGAAHGQSPVAAVREASPGHGSGNGSPQPPVLSSDIAQYFVSSSGDTGVCRPFIIGVADVGVSNAANNVDEQYRVTLVAPVSDGPIPLDWALAERRTNLDPRKLSSTPPEGVRFMPVPPEASRPANYAPWGKQLQQWLAANETLTLMKSRRLKLISGAGESERDFRLRLDLAARELRDAYVDKLREKYASRIATAQERVRRAEQTAERQQGRVTQARTSAAMAGIAAAIDLFSGKKRLSATTINKIGTAARGAGRTVQQQGDVARANETVEVLRQRLDDLEKELENDIRAAKESYDMANEALETVVIKPKRTDIQVQFVGLLWVPDDEH